MKTYPVHLTEEEIEWLVSAVGSRRHILAQHPTDMTRSSSNPMVRFSYHLENLLYTALLKEYAADLADQAAAVAAEVLARHDAHEKAVSLAAREVNERTRRDRSPQIDS